MTHAAGAKVRFAAALTVGVIAAASTFAYGSGTALAPEPARLTTPLGSAGGATAAGYYAYSPMMCPVDGYAFNGMCLYPTTVYKLGGTFVTSSIPPGSPCSPVPLASGETTIKVVVAAGTLRACR